MTTMAVNVTWKMHENKGLSETNGAYSHLLFESQKNLGKYSLQSTMSQLSRWTCSTKMIFPTTIPNNNTSNSNNSRGSPVCMVQIEQNI